METKIYDRRGRIAPTVTLTEIRRRPGRFFKLTDRRGTVVIRDDGETLAVALSLEQFVSMVFGIHARPRLKKHRTQRKAGRKR